MVKRSCELRTPQLTQSTCQGEMYGVVLVVP